MNAQREDGHPGEGRGAPGEGRRWETAASIYNTPLKPGAAGVVRRPVVYDTTLRDGEQMPGVKFTSPQKLDIARLLDAAGVPEIEAGFPAVSPAECSAIKAVAGEGLSARTLVLTRLKEGDVELARACDADMTLIFIASSPSHLEHKLRTDIGTIAERIPRIIDMVKEQGMEPSFSTEDSTRTPISDLRRLHGAALDAGAVRIGVTDTAGCASPRAVGDLVAEVKKFTPVPLSVHLHNDFGMATANAVAGVAAGAEAVAVTVNGMGERAGNVALEEFVMSMEVLYGVDMGMDTTLFSGLSELVSRHSGVPVGQCKPLVGNGAFTHESGIHVAAVMEEPSTYEPIPPEMVGNSRRLTMGKHSGLRYVMERLHSAGIEADDEQTRRILAAVKRAGEINGRVDEDQFSEIVRRVTGRSAPPHDGRGENPA